MCEIVCVGNRFGVFSFTTGFTFKTEPTLVEWAKTDFDACFNYLFRQGMDDIAEELFEYLSRTMCGNARSH